MSAPHLVFSLSVGLASAFNAVSTTAAEWQPLLDVELSQWDTYLGYPNADTPVEGLPRDEEGNYSKPVGHNRDEHQVFTAELVDGEPVLHISGEIYGGIYTREDYGNYHLRLQFKWGDKKWAPRLNLPMDSGILYHAVGEHGVDYWRAWPLSQEFQVIAKGEEGLTGDWWQIANAQIQIRCRPETEGAPPQFDPEAPLVTFGYKGAGNYCRASHNQEKPKGEWNTLDLLTVGDRSLHIVNGEVVMALRGSSRPTEDGMQPLTRGRILLQSEAAEVFYRRIKIQPLDTLPTKYGKWF